jgi:hypothetical protein
MQEPVIVDEGHKHNRKKEIHCRRRLKIEKKSVLQGRRAYDSKIIPFFFLAFS